MRTLLHDVGAPPPGGVGAEPPSWARAVVPLAQLQPSEVLCRVGVWGALARGPRFDERL